MRSFMSRMKLSYMAPSWKTPLKDMRPGLPGRPRAGRRCPMNMPEHLECSDESLSRMYRSRPCAEIRVKLGHRHKMQVM